MIDTSGSKIETDACRLIVQSGSLSTMSLIARIAVCTEAAASPALNAASATAADANHGVVFGFLIYLRAALVNHAHSKFTCPFFSAAALHPFYPGGCLQQFLVDDLVRGRCPSLSTSQFRVRATVQTEAKVRASLSLYSSHRLPLVTAQVSIEHSQDTLGE